ncbi:polysaccharide deacetylase family protein [Sulfurimonas aquatica]|uniref:Polysaccharide deacetylase family protein n=1 Tax=Sulfurimonas aquatica TaxID=2672570 RepID=A0A975B2D3_9BACT|nr:polysaccharide deacetylase family protein [Sulfurimonas aquatica]QSZ42914.1 polysaccharide deacetylase family protein [Sulfurimonas aquatica]
MNISLRLQVIFVLMLMITSMDAQEINKTYNSSQKQNMSAIVFMYHRFGESTYPSTNIRLEQFKRQLDYLEQKSFKVWPFSKIARYVLEGKNIPHKTVALTIDDAYISVYTKAFPLLKEKKYPFTVFVNTSAVGGKSINYVSWEQIREMRLHGGEFANHSLTHDVLLPCKDESKQKWQSRLKKEIEGAQEKLHEELGIHTNENPKLLSYPFGEYSQATAEFIKRLGYIGVTQTSGAIDLNSDLKALPRFAMSETFSDLDGFVLKLNTLALPIASLSPYEPLVKENNPPKLTLKLKYPMKRMNCFTSNGEGISIKWLSDLEAEVQASKTLNAPRDRYTCTAPSEDGKWFWYSHLWIIN